MSQEYIFHSDIRPTLYCKILLETASLPIDSYHHAYDQRRLRIVKNCELNYIIYIINSTYLLLDWIEKKIKKTSYNIMVLCGGEMRYVHKV